MGFKLNRNCTKIGLFFPFMTYNHRRFHQELVRFSQKKKNPKKQKNALNCRAVDFFVREDCVQDNKSERSKMAKSPHRKSCLVSRLWTDPETPDRDSHRAALTGLNSPDLDKAAFPSLYSVTWCCAVKQHSSSDSRVHTLRPGQSMCVCVCVF